MRGEFVPDASGPYARSLADIFDTHGRFGALIGTVKDYGISVIPDDWVPWLIYDLGLEDIVPYIRTFRQALAEGPAWQRTRGTPTGIEIGIGWVESEGRVAAPDGRHNWWEFQVGFTRPPQDLAHIRQLDGIIRLSKASEDELFRMFSPEYDHRPVRMDEHRFDDGGWMDGYSGVPRWDGGPLLSFGRDEAGVVDQAILVTGATLIEATVRIDWFDAMRFDRDRFGAAPEAIWLTGQTLDGTRARSLAEDDTWPEQWPEGPWSEAGGSTVFVAVARRDSATLLATYDDDTWSDRHPDEPWAAATGSMPIPTEAERS